MARPEVSPTTERIYGLLPEVMRDADAKEPSGAGYPLLRYLSLIGDQLDELSVLIDRISYVAPTEGGADGDTSDLVDARAADPGWLRWLAQLVGVRLNTSLGVEAQRELVASASSGWLAGTPGAIAGAVRGVLTGSRSVAIYPHYAGDPWVLEIRTRPAETPSAQAVIDAVLASGAKPAGVALVVTMADASWDQVAAAWPTWDAVEALEHWNAYETEAPWS